MLAEGKIDVDEADRLLARAGPAEAAERPAGRRGPAFLRVLVRGGAAGEEVDLRVPLRLIRAGVRLSALMPEGARSRVEAALGEKGIHLDLGKAGPGAVEELVAALAELRVEVRGADGETVSVFCE